MNSFATRSEVTAHVQVHPKKMRVIKKRGLQQARWRNLSGSQSLPFGDWPWRSQVLKSLPKYCFTRGSVPEKTRNAPLPEHAESFIIDIGEDYLYVRGVDERGLRCALLCLRDLYLAPVALPVLRIEDWPSMKTRGVMIDLGRVAEKPSVVRSLITYLADQRANTLMLYLEDKIAIPGHKTIASDFAYTLKQISALAAYAKKHHIDLLPSFSLFGHATHILNKKKYAHLSDGPQAYQLNPLHKETKSLCVDHIRAWNKSVTGTTVMHMGCDETPYTGLCQQTKKFISKHGEAEFFARHVRFMHKALKRNGQRMAIWGDMLRHHPDIIPLIPNDVIIYDWNYGPIPESWAKILRKLIKRGFEVIVVPAASRSAEVFMPDKVHHQENIPQFIELGIKEGASGVMVSTWEAFNLFNTFSRPGYGLGMHLAWEGQCKPKALKRLTNQAAASVFGKNGSLFLQCLEQHGSFHLYQHFRKIHWDKTVREKTYHLMSHELMPTDPILYGTAAESTWTKTLRLHPGQAARDLIKQINMREPEAHRLSDMLQWYTMVDGIRSLPRTMYASIHRAFREWELHCGVPCMHALQEALDAAQECADRSQLCLQSAQRWWGRDRYLADYEFDRCFKRRWDWALRSSKQWIKVLKKSLSDCKHAQRPAVFDYYENLHIHFVRMPHHSSEVNILVIEVEAQNKQGAWDTFINLHAFQLPNTEYCYAFIAPDKPSHLRCQITRTQTPWSIDQLQWSMHALPALGDATSPAFACSEYRLGAQIAEMKLRSQGSDRCKLDLLT